MMRSVMTGKCLKIRFRIFFIAVAMMLASCNESYKSSIPDMSFSPVRINMLQAGYSVLRSPGYFISIDDRYGYRVGYAGLIVGQSSYDMDFEGNMVYYAFDSACPVEADPKVSVTISEDHCHALCPSCKTEYDLNGGGSPVSGEGKEFLKRYKVERVGADVIVIYGD